MLRWMLLLLVAAPMLVTAQNITSIYAPVPRSSTFNSQVDVAGAEAFILFNGDYSFDSVSVELFKFFIFWFSGVLGGVAGGAGGALFIPVLLVLFNFHIYAIPLSRAAVFGAALAFAYQNLLNMRTPRGFPSLFAWDVIAMMEPMTLLGTSFGVRLNKMCPQWLIIIVLVAVLGTSAWETWKKALSKHQEEDLQEQQQLEAKQAKAEATKAVQKVETPTKKAVDEAAESLSLAVLNALQESEPAGTDKAAGTVETVDILQLGTRDAAPPAVEPKQAKQQAEEPEEDDEDDIIKMIKSLPNGGSSKTDIALPIKSSSAASKAASNPTAAKTVVVSVPGTDSAELTFEQEVHRSAAALNITPAQMLIYRQPISSWRCMFSVGICWLVVLILNFELGGSGKFTRSGIECGSATFWFLWMCSLPVVLGVTWWNAVHLNNIETAREAIGIVLPREQIRWTARNLSYYSIACLLAGVVGALAGVGGSTIKQPLMLQFGLEPMIAQASAQLMLLSTVSSVMIQYAYLQMLPSGYALVFLVLGFASGYSGKALMDFYVKKFNRTALIVYALSLYTLAAAISLTIIGIVNVVKDYQHQHWNRFWFQTMCALLPGRSG